MPHVETLGRFGHSPDPAVDFCVETEWIGNEWANTKAGFTNGTPPIEEIARRLNQALDAYVGNNQYAVAANCTLREIEAEMKAAGVPMS